jgi:hypothetical protein
MNKNVDLSIANVNTAVRLTPHFMKQFRFILPLELHQNDPTSFELKALQQETGNNVDLQYVYKKPFISFVVEPNEFIANTLTSNLSKLFSFRKPEKCLVEFRSNQ